MRTQRSLFVALLTAAALVAAAPAGAAAIFTRAREGRVRVAVRRF